MPNILVICDGANFHRDAAVRQLGDFGQVVALESKEGVDHLGNGHSYDVVLVGCLSSKTNVMDLAAKAVLKMKYVGSMGNVHDLRRLKAPAECTFRAVPPWMDDYRLADLSQPVDSAQLKSHDKVVRTFDWRRLYRELGVDYSTNDIDIPW
jgi:hypothetical protein